MSLSWRYHYVHLTGKETDSERWNHLPPDHTSPKCPSKNIPGLPDTERAPSTTLTVSDDAWWAQNTDYVHQSSCKVCWSAPWGPRCKVGPARYQTHHAQMPGWHTQLKSQKALYLKKKTQKKFNLMGLKKGSAITLHRLNMIQFQGVSFT